MTALAQLPFAQAHPLATAPGLRALQSRGPIHRVRTAVGDDAWMVTGHALLRQLMDDDRLGRSHPEPGTAARSGDSALFGGPLGEFETEAADHARMRALLQPHFTPKHMRSLAPKLDALIAGRLDELEKHGCPADLHAEVALPVPILVICDLLGVPYSDRDQFRAWVDDAGCVNDRARSEHGLAELFGYGMTLVERKHAHPDDDVISRLCATEGVGDLEAATLSMQLLFAGHETTVVAIGRGTLLLLTNRDQWQALLDDPALIPHAVEELLRAGPPGGIGIPRYARTDLDIAGVTIRAGDLVLLDIGSANFDPAAFSSPEHLDVTRKEAVHVTFGYGPRYCLGAALARMELKAVFGQLIPRFPAMRLAVDPATLAVRTDALAKGLVGLPVLW